MTIEPHDGVIVLTKTQRSLCCYQILKFSQIETNKKIVASVAVPYLGPAHNHFWSLFRIVDMGVPCTAHLCSNSDHGCLTSVIGWELVKPILSASKLLYISVSKMCSCASRPILQIHTFTDTNIRNSGTEIG